MNYGKKHDLPFGIMDVAGLLRLNIRRRAPGQVYVDCPICGDRRGKMNLNTAKDLWRCNYCGEGGGMLSLYAKVYGVSNSDAYLLMAGQVAESHQKEVAKKLRKRLWLEAENVNACYIRDGELTNGISDEDNLRLIKNELIDGASTEINDMSDYLLGFLYAEGDK